MKVKCIHYPVEGSWTVLSRVSLQLCTVYQENSCTEPTIDLKADFDNHHILKEIIASLKSFRNALISGLHILCELYS